MHILITSKFKMDPINSNPEKVEASIFLTMKAGLLHS